MNTLSMETCVEALNRSAMNRKVAIQLEIAVGLAVFLLHSGAGKDARTMLNDAYAAAGYRCSKVSEIDYKTINRRINATAELYEKLPVATWAGKLREEKLLIAMYQGIEPYEFYTIADVQRFCHPERVTAPPSQQLKVKPNTDILTPAAGGGEQKNHSGQDKVVSMFRRAADQVAKGARHIETQHLALMIPKDTNRNELIELAMRLLEIANEKELLTA